MKSLSTDCGKCLVFEYFLSNSYILAHHNLSCLTKLSQPLETINKMNPSSFRMFLSGILSRPCKSCRGRGGIKLILLHLQCAGSSGHLGDSRNLGSNRGRENQTTKSEAWIPQETQCMESCSPRSLLLDLARPEGQPVWILSSKASLVWLGWL